MKRIILVSTFFLLFTSFMCLNAQWAITYGGDKRDSASSIQQTDDGGYIVAGYTGSFGAGGIWILKLSAFGEIEWQRTYGGSGVPFIQQTRDGGYVVVSSGFLILKLSSEGEIEWQKTYRGGDYDIAYSIRQTNDDGYVVAGKSSSFSGDVYISDIWILKLSSEGEIEWQKTYGGNAPDEFHSIQQTSDGGYIVAGGTRSFGDPNDSDIWILKLSSTGAVEWQKTYGGSNWETGPSVQQTNDGGYIVASTFGQGGGDIWILKLSSEGEIEWQKTYGGSAIEEAQSICQTTDGGYIVAGSTAPSEDGGCYDSNALILKLSSDGNIEWQKTYGGSGNEEAHSICQTTDGGYIVAGETDSWGVGGEIWVLKLTSNGDINPTCAFIKSSDVGVLDTDISPENTNLVPKDTYIAPQDEDITPQESDAVVYELCSEQCTLTLTADYGGTTEPEPGTYTYETGTEITLRAIATVSDRAFATWAGNVFCDHNPVTIIMDGDKSIEARFYIPGYDPGGEGGGRGNGCFTMELASGSPLYHYVGILREFRDKCLRRCKFGCALIKTYYEYSPFLADLISKHKILKIVIRINLLPLVVFSYSMLHFGPLITAAKLIFIFALPIFLIAFFRKKFRRVEAKKTIKPRLLGDEMTANADNRLVNERRLG